MLRTIEKEAAEVLAGRANTVPARHYLMVEVDRLAEEVINAWTKFGVQIEQYRSRQETKQVASQS
jgi:hypothetical protein